VPARVFAGFQSQESVGVAFAAESNIKVQCWDVGLEVSGRQNVERQFVEVRDCRCYKM
jgi:hypothetical protein